MTTEKSLSVPDLEKVYDALANSIDQARDNARDKAGVDKTQLFLVKLALLNANALGNVDLFETHLQAALLDL